MRTKILSAIILALLWATIFCTQTTFAQQDPRFSQYMFNGLVMNPAYAGTGEVAFVSAFYRKQWVSLDWAPQTATVSVQNVLGSRCQYGIGGYMGYDQIGVHKTINLSGAYAYRVPLGSLSYRLSIGLSANLIYMQHNWNDIQTVTPDDPIFAQADNSNFMPNFGMGVFLDLGSFYFGASVPNVLELKYGPSGITGTNLAGKMYRHYYVSTGGVVRLTDGLKLNPSALVKVVSGGLPNSLNAPMQVDANLNFIIKDMLWLGSSFRFQETLQPESVDFIASFRFKNGMRIGYAYDLTLSELSAFTSGSHEIGFQMQFGERKGRYKTPRYF